jgi:RNA polymerase sigma-70 factor (ECF subfamily)
MLGCREDAEDVVQEVFVALVRSRRRLADVRDLTAYLFAALRRAAGRCAARRARGIALSEFVAEQIVAAAARHDCSGPSSERLEHAVRALPAEQREVIALKIDGELTFAQIGEVLGVSINTAASRYRYALERLRAALGEGC